MRKYAVFLVCFVLLVACAKHDPILPGTRTAIFDTKNLEIMNKKIPNLPDEIPNFKKTKCDYIQNTSNEIFDGDKKIFSGFPTENSVKSNQHPVCDKDYVYAGLTTGELVKVNPKNHQVLWIADIYRANNFTTGSSITDIVAPIEIRGDYLYAGGLGDAFCKISASSGAKKWCLDIGVAYPFVITNNVAFVVGTDNYLYAIDLNSGKIYWRTQVQKQMTPIYKNKILNIGKQKIDATTGKIIK